MFPPAVVLQAAQEIPETSEPSPQLDSETIRCGSATETANAETANNDSAAWRQEVAARLNRYHSRRKPRPPRYPSLRLRFEENEATAAASPAHPEDSRGSQIMPVVSNQALAFDRFADDFEPEPVFPAAAPAFAGAEHEPAADSPAMAPVTAKIIEFPRSWAPPPAPFDELAEPVTTRPRILEAPELVPPPPALGGITIEPAPHPEFEKRPGIDIPLQAAPLARRVLSAAIDDVVIALACALFAFIFWKLTAIRPPRIQMIGFLAGLASLFWAAYQYLLVVYAGTTPGLLLARLELSRFDGSRVPRRLRRWRVLASFLSAVSLGMGYGWVFLDEDSLCWHDRITHTYLAPKRHAADPQGSTNG
jgi:uncharacterized RDD family membrane protein YckC